MISPLLTLAATTAAAPKETGSGLFGPIAKPIASVLAAFYHVVPDYGVDILLLSVVWMLVISPLTLKSTRSMLAMQKVQPEIQKLKEQHKNDRQAFAQAQMDLFKERGVSPFGSCLPTLLPLPVFFALFRVIDGLSHKTKGVPTPEYLSPHTQMYKDIVHAGGSIHSFGLDLAKNALSSHSSFAAAIPFFLLLLVMGGTQYLQTAQMMSRNPAAADNPQMKMMKYLPIIFTVICIRFPAGVVLYYSMSNLCRIAQQSLMYRYDPKVRTLAKREVIEVESHITEYEDQHRRNRGGGAGANGKPGSGGKGPSNGGSNGGGKAKAITTGSSAAGDEPKPAARSRFAALLETAKENQARQAQAKSAAAGKSNGNQAKTNGAPKNGGPAKAPAAKGSPTGKNAAGNRTAATSGSKGTNGGTGNKTGSGPVGKNGGPVGKTGGPVGKTGANGNGNGGASRTGARSGGQKKRRGR